jgi:hypothetical protein
MQRIGAHWRDAALKNKDLRKYSLRAMVNKAWGMSCAQARTQGDGETSLTLRLGVE